MEERVRNHAWYIPVGLMAIIITFGILGAVVGFEGIITQVLLIMSGAFVGSFVPSAVSK